MPPHQTRTQAHLKICFSQCEFNIFSGNVLKFQRLKPYDIYKNTTLLTGICIVVVCIVCQEPLYYNMMPFTKFCQCQCKHIQNLICINYLTISYMCSVVYLENILSKSSLFPYNPRMLLLTFSLSDFNDLVSSINATCMLISVGPPITA